MTENPSTASGERTPAANTPLTPQQILTLEPNLAGMSPRDAEQVRLAIYFQRLYVLTPIPWMTGVLIAGVVGWFLAMLVMGVDMFDPSSAELVAYGANFGPFTLNGQWWRLFSCMFVHVGLMHLVFNLWALYVVGPLLERMLGSAGFLLLYGISGAVGSMASVVMNPDVVSAGASGAVFGTVGGLLGFLLLSRHHVPVSAFKSLRNGIGLFIVLNLALGFMIPMIDNSAHLGGLIAGFLCGTLLSQKIDIGTPRRRLIRNLALLLAGGGSVAVGVVFLPAIVDWLHG